MKKFALFVSLFVWSFLLGKADEPIDDSLLEKREINGERMYFLKNKKEPYTGKSVKLYDSGNKWVVNHIKGKMDGLSVYSYPNGAKAYIDFYENGKMVYAKSWKPDGSICDVTNVVDGEGVAQTYHPKGPIEWRANFKNGLYNGVETWFYENGQKKSETNQNNDKLDGLSTYWYENGQKSSETTYLEDKLHGLRTQWYENGQKKLEGYWKNGRENGTRTEWYESGQKSAEANFKEGKQDGTTTLWHNNGQIREVSNFVDGKLHGNSKIFDILGKETWRGTHHKGVLTYEHKSP
jgi:antitoxin component YwqK of YwqJK toxin-antitoxin module